MPSTNPFDPDNSDDDDLPIPSKNTASATSMARGWGHQRRASQPFVAAKPATSTSPVLIPNAASGAGGSFNPFIKPLTGPESTAAAASSNWLSSLMSSPPPSTAAPAPNSATAATAPPAAAPTAATVTATAAAADQRKSSDDGDGEGEGRPHSHSSHHAHNKWEAPRDDPDSAFADGRSVLQPKHLTLKKGAAAAGDGGAHAHDGGGQHSAAMDLFKTKKKIVLKGAKWGRDELLDPNHTRHNSAVADAARSGNFSPSPVQPPAHIRSASAATAAISLPPPPSATGSGGRSPLTPVLSPPITGGPVPLTHRSSSAGPTFATPRERELWEQTEALRQRVIDLEGAIRKTKLVSAAHILDEVANGSYHAVYAARKYATKMELLDVAIERSTADGADPMTVLVVLLFLRETLAPALFLESIKRYDWALNMLIAHLERSEASELLFDLYRALNRPKDAGMHKLRLAYKEKNPHDRLAALKAVAVFFERNKLSFEQRQVAHNVSLLERQIPIEVKDSEVAAEGKEAIYRQTKRWNIIDSPLSQTLYYTLVYHPIAKKEKLSSPRGLAEHFSISEPHFCWMSLRARARVGDWTTVKGLITRGGFFSKAASPIGFEPFFQTLTEYRAPADVQADVASCVSDAEERYQLCVRFGWFELAIKALIALVDPNRLIDLSGLIVAKLGATSVQSVSLRNQINEALTTSAMKKKLTKS